MIRYCPCCAGPLMSSLTSCWCGWNIYSKPPRDLGLEKAHFERMIASTSQASQDYNRGKFLVVDED